MSLEAWEELTPNMDKGIRKLPIIRDPPVHWWVLKIVDGFGPHTSSLKLMETYEKYKVLMLKEEGDTSYVCQRYYQDAAKQDKEIFRDDNSVLCSWILATRCTLNSW